MSIREVPLTPNTPTPRSHRLLSIVIDADQGLTAVWVVELANGRREQRSVKVSDGLTALITARSTFKAVLDQISTDTAPS